MNSWKQFYLLLFSLSKAEKRHFKLLASLHEGEKKYLAALDELERAVAPDMVLADDFELDEHTLKSRLARKGIQSPVRAVRAYLSGGIFRSLRLLEEGKTKKDEAKTLLQEGIILERRALFEAAAQRFEAALELAEQYEFLPLGIEIIRHLQNVRAQQNLKNYREQILALCAKMEDMAAKMQTECAYQSLHLQIFNLLRTLRNAHTPAVLPEVGKLETHPLLSGAAQPPTFMSHIYFFGSLANLASIKLDKKTAQIHCKSIVNIWEQHPHQQAEQPRKYLIALSNYLTHCLTVSDLSDFPAHIAKMKAIKTETYDDEAEQFQTLAHLEHLYFLNTDQLEQAVAMTPNIEKGLAEHQLKINRAREITLRSNIAIAYFALGAHETAMEKLNALFNLGKSEHRPDLISMSKLLQLVLHFELRHDQYLDQLVKNTGQNLRDNEQFFDFERLVLANMSRLAQVRNKHLPVKDESAAMAPLFERFAGELAGFAAKTQGRHTPGLEEVSLWAETYRTGKTFRQLLLEKAAVPT